MSLVATFGDMLVEYKTPNIRIGTFGVVNPDYQQVWREWRGVSHVSRNTRNGVTYNAPSGKAVPATCRFVDDTPVKANCSIQNWMFDLCSSRAGLSLSKRQADWHSLTRDNAYITNFAGSNTRHDCINGTNADKEYMQFQPMVCGGSLLKIVGEGRVAMHDIYYIEAINPFADFAQYYPDFHKWLFYEPTLSARYWIDEEKKNALFYAGDCHPDKATEKQEWYNEPFHQFGENALLPVMGMLKDNRSSTGWVNSVDKDRVYLLDNDEPVPNPFIMRFGRVRDNFYEGF